MFDFRSGEIVNHRGRRVRAGVKQRCEMMNHRGSRGSRKCKRRDEEEK